MHCSNQHHKPNSNQELWKKHFPLHYRMFVWILISVAYVFGNSIRFIWRFHSIFDFCILTTQLYIRYTQLCILSVKFTFWTYSMSNATFELIQSNILFWKWCFIYPKQIISFWSHSCIPCVILIFFSCGKKSLNSWSIFIYRFHFMQSSQNYIFS